MSSPDVMRQLYDRYDEHQFRAGMPNGAGDDHPRIAQILRLVGSSQRVLDVGASYGEFSRPLSRRGKKVVAWDISSRTVEMCKSSGLEAYQINIETDPIIECGRFDIILMLEIFEHLIDPLLALKKLKPLLKPSGLLILSTPNAAYIKWRLELMAGRLPDFGEDRELSNRPFNLLHKTPVTLAILTAVIEEAGFEILSVEPEEYGTSGYWARFPFKQIRHWLRQHWSTLFSGSFVVSARPI